MPEPTGPEAITPEIFDHLVHLAALQLSAEEADYLRQELNRQIRAIRELESFAAIPTHAAAFHGIAYLPEMIPPNRPDCWTPFPNPEEILHLGPEVESGYYVVPDLPRQDLE